jgi:multidrug resistance efflux pump
MVSNTVDEGAAPKKSRRPLVFAVIGLLALAAITYGVRFVLWSSGHVSTDDAAITSDVISIAPQVTGTVTKVDVSSNQHVKKGDLLVELDPSTYQTAVLQAQATLTWPSRRRRAPRQTSR